jgi:uncharacterized repeat protein (TIGR03803 family)
MAVCVPAAQAQTLTTLETFNFTDGAHPYAGLVQAGNGGYYGTTTAGGTANHGTVYVTSPAGGATTRYSFCSMPNCVDGSDPNGGLVQSSSGDFYGTTVGGGRYGDGTVFRITPGGSLTTLYSFNGTDGAAPYAGLVAALDGNFYGTTQAGGSHGDGTVFSITPAGALTTLHAFQGADGARPSAALLESGDGVFYGTTAGGGTGDNGTAFAITADGALSTLHRFDGTDGAHPYSALVAANDGRFYATTVDGGPAGDGTVFSIDRQGHFATVHAFAFSDGAHPYAGLVQATDGAFYGTTVGGGALEYGTIFRMTAAGEVTTLHDACSLFLCADGALTYSALVQATDGNLYGTTTLGGASDDNEIDAGTVFALSVGLAAFIETKPTSGPLGTVVRILGDHLAGATQVFFNDAPAAFRVVSATEILTAVPSGAATGVVEVVTPGGVLNSNSNFVVY